MQDKQVPMPGKYPAIVIIFAFLFLLSWTPEKIVLTVMSYNVHHCNPPSKKGVIDIDTIAGVIRKANPDIVALQEIDVYTGRSGRINEIEQIALKAGYPYYFFGRAIDFDGGKYGIAIMSKFPLSDTTVHALPTDSTTKGEHRALALAKVRLQNGKTFQFASTHLDALDTNINRLLQAKAINTVAGRLKGPTIIAGDFNATEGSEVIGLLDRKFTRSCKRCETTLPGSASGKAIDFIAFRPKKKFTVLSHQVIREHYASDHFPVVTSLQLDF